MRQVTASAARRSRRDDGVSLVLVSLTMVAMLIVVAIVIDLSALRVDRRAGQLAADAAAAAGASAIEDGGVVACSAALDYAVLNLDGAAGLNSLGCVSLPAVCDPTTLPVTATAVDGDTTLSITYPVPDGHPLLRGSIIGRPGVAVSSADGSLCDRMGIEIIQEPTSLFGEIVPGATTRTAVHAVGLSDENSGPSIPINVLLLDRHACQAISAGGGGSTGGIIVGAVTEPGADGVVGTPDDELVAGVLAADSDGRPSTGACTPKGVLNVNGSGSTVRADGPPGCGTDVGATPQGEGCGQILLFADGASGCNLPACSSGGVLQPGPEQLEERLTRTSVDHRFNCKADYQFEPWYAQQDIVGCTGSGRAYIDELVTYARSGLPAGFARYEWGVDQVSGTADDRSCSPNAAGIVTIPEGNWLVGCADFRVGQEVVFAGGNVIFAGDVTVNGRLVIHDCARTDTCSPTLGYSPGADFDETRFSDDAAWVFVRNGTVRNTASGSIGIYESMVYLSSTSTTNFGGSGPVAWEAPLEGPFADLALWSEASGSHKFSGGSNLDLLGVFFLPLGLIDYVGGGNQVAEAQFIAGRLNVSGNGALTVTPPPGRAIVFPVNSIELIR